MPLHFPGFFTTDAIFCFRSVCRPDFVSRDYRYHPCRRKLIHSLQPIFMTARSVGGDRQNLGGAIRKH